jgi:hypothetical protein
MKNSLRFTVKELASLEPAEKRTRYHDTGVDGLILEVYPSGTKSFRVYKRAKGAKSPSQVTLGTFPSLTCAPHDPTGAASVREVPGEK